MTSTYRLYDIERAIGDDPSTAELNIHLTEHDGRLHVRGAVATSDRRDRVLALVRASAPDADVVDEIDVAGDDLGTQPGRPEVLS